MAVLQRAAGKLVGSVFIFNIAVAKLTLADELELVVFHMILKMVVISVSWKEFQKIDGRVDSTHIHKTHLCSTV